MYFSLVLPPNSNPIEHQSRKTHAHDKMLGMISAPFTSFFCGAEMGARIAKCKVSVADDDRLHSHNLNSELNMQNQYYLFYYYRTNMPASEVNCQEAVNGSETA